MSTRENDEKKIRKVFSTRCVDIGAIDIFICPTKNIVPGSIP